MPGTGFEPATYYFLHTNLEGSRSIQAELPGHVISLFN